MQKILLVSHSQKNGGAERCLHEMALGLREKGFQVILLLPSDGDLYTLLKRDKLETIISPYPWWVHFEHELNFWGIIKKILTNIKYVYRITKTIKRIEPDFVLTNTLCICVAAFGSFFLGKKHYWFIHEFGKEDHRLIFDLGFYFSSKIMDITSKHVFVNSQLIKQKFSKFIDSKKIDILNMNVPVPVGQNHLFDKNLSKHTFDLLIVGQINKNKGQIDGIKALNILRKKGFQCRLFIVGQVSDLGYYNELCRFIQENQLVNYVKFLEHNDSPYGVIERFTIGLMCSEFEAFGRVTIEYMKLNIPVFGAKSSNTPNLIKDGYNGVLYELRNSEDLAEKIIQTILNENQLNQIITTAHQFATDNFKVENYINGLLNRINN